MESDFKKQKRLGPAPIASFEKSFEDSTAPAAAITGPSMSSTSITAALQIQGQEANASSESDKDLIIAKVTTMKQSVTTPTTSSINMSSTISSTTTANSAMPSSGDQQQPPLHHQPTTKAVTPLKKLHDMGKRPPPLATASVNISVQSTTSMSGDGRLSIGSAAPLSSLGTTLGVNTPSTPRIDISRASSSSHHEDSRDSSPENVFEQVGTGTLQEAIGLGFREEGALELRSSTEELYFMDPEQKKEEQEKIQQARKSPVIFKFDEHQTYLQQHQRKDSASSEVAALLCISGRTSRISSVGSQGSAVSRLSAVSGISRSPSPHRMLLETSFCGPKPLENVVDGSIVSSVEPPTAEILEQVLLSRKHDPTQAVLAEGIQIESSPKKTITNGEAKRKASLEKMSEFRAAKTAASTTASKAAPRKGIVSMPKRGSATKPVVGVTPGGTEYIRIKLKPDYLYDDKGLAPNERLLDENAPPSEPLRKPASLSLGRDVTSTVEQRLTPSSSPKPARHTALARESRSPSPATVAVSRKSSFCSLFKTKDSPDSPRDRSRSRSKSRDRSTPQSQSGTPSKQKSVLTIFKPKRSGSKSKCSSPVDQDPMSALDGISQVELKFKPDQVESKSRPSSRLRYYDTPLDGKTIHIPLHTPPDEREDRRFVSSREVKEPEPPPSSQANIHSTTASISAPSSKTPVSEDTIIAEKVPPLPHKTPKPAQVEKLQRIENLDAIHTLPQDVNKCERTWSMEVQRHSSQESQETASVDSSVPIHPRRISKPNLTDVIESPVRENGVPPSLVQNCTVQISQQQMQQQTQQSQAISGTNSQSHFQTSKEKKRLLFATKLGSGSEEQIFSTQFSLSKTESLSSQLSEQTSVLDSPAAEGRETLHRMDTVIRRPDESFTQATSIQSGTAATKRRESSDIAVEDTKPTVIGVIQKTSSSEEVKRKSKSTSEEEEIQNTGVAMRKKESEDNKRKSKSASEEDDCVTRHSRHAENFDGKKKLPSDNRRQTSRNSSDSSIKDRDSYTSSREEHDINSTPVVVPQIPVKSSKLRDTQSASGGPSERQSVISTDDFIESSESERDTEMGPNRIKRHLPRHISAVEDHESTGLVSQDSFEDELPYVPTTLPEERAHGVSLIPMKERINMELKTCSVDRPRSTTPMNPACLEEYCGIITPDDNDNVPVRGEKLRISLPRKDSTKEKSQKSKSPRRISNASGKSWFEFAEQGIRGSSTTTPTQPCAGETRRGSNQDDEPPPPLPPRKPSTSTSGQWINFENIPEKRKPPKRITALPKDSPQDSKPPMQPHIQYNYVKPEECQCECHEVERESAAHKSITSVDLLQQGEDMQPLLEPESQEGIDPSDSSVDYSYGADVSSTVEQKPFEMDLSLGQPSSNRSSIHSQEPDSPDRVPIMHDSSSMSSSNRQSRSPPDYRNP